MTLPKKQKKKKTIAEVVDIRFVIFCLHFRICTNEGMWRKICSNRHKILSGDSQLIYQ